jgi:branched-chain amino acid transport system ATP-binding protein
MTGTSMGAPAGMSAGTSPGTSGHATAATSRDAAGAPVLSVVGLCKRFGALTVAQDIALDLHAGARIGLIGPNGAGKSTFVNLLTGMLAPDAGSIRLDGEPIDRLRPERRVRRGLVRTHQINALLREDSACDNVAIAIAERKGLGWRMFRYGPGWRACTDEAQGRLADLGLADVAHRPASELPYGKQRLLEIAIALALAPRVLLLDEPGAGVPSDESHQIHDRLAELPTEVAILMIEHDMDLVFRFAREIVVMVQGRVLMRGTPAEVAADAQVRALYLGAAGAPTPAGPADGRRS